MSSLQKYFTGNVSWKTVGLRIAFVLYVTIFFEVSLPNSPGIQEDKLHIEVLLQWLPVEFVLINTLPIISA